MHLGSLESPQEARVASRLRLEQLLRFFRAHQTSRVYPSLDIRTLSMNQFLNVRTAVLNYDVCSSKEAAKFPSSHLQVSFTKVSAMCGLF